MRGTSANDNGTANARSEPLDHGESGIIAKLRCLPAGRPREDGDVRICRRRDILGGVDRRSEALDWRRLLNIERLAGGDVSRLVDQPYLVEPVARCDRVRDRSAERARPDNGYD